MQAHVQRSSVDSPDRPDVFYALLAGFYAAMVVTPAVVVGLDLWVTDGAGVLYLGLLGSVSIITVLVAAVTARLRGLPERIGATKLAWGLVVLPLLGGVGCVALGALSPAVLGRGTTAVGFPTGALGMLSGVALVTKSRARYVDAVVGEPPVDCEWSASVRRSWRDRAPGMQYAVVVLLLAVFVASVVWRIERWYVAGPMLFVHLLLLQAPVPDHQRSYQVTPLGLERLGVAVAGRTFHFWDRFESFEVTDDALVLHWQSWCRPATRFALADLDDPVAVEETLGQYLPRA